MDPWGGGPAEVSGLITVLGSVVSNSVSLQEPGSTVRLFAELKVLGILRPCQGLPGGARPGQGDGIACKVVVDPSHAGPHGMNEEIPISRDPWGRLRGHASDCGGWTGCASHGLPELGSDSVPQAQMLCPQ